MSRRKQSIRVNHLSQSSCFSFYQCSKSKQSKKQQILVSLNKPIFYNKSIECNLPKSKHYFVCQKAQASLGMPLKSIFKDTLTPSNKRVAVRTKKYTEGYQQQRNFTDKKRKSSVIQRMQTRQDFMNVIKHLSSLCQTKAKKKDTKEFDLSFIEITGTKFNQNSPKNMPSYGCSMLKRLKQKPSIVKNQDFHNLLTLNKRNLKNGKQNIAKRRINTFQHQQLCGWN